MTQQHSQDDNERDTPSDEKISSRSLGGSRRYFLGAVATAAVAGCIGDDNGDDDDSAPSDDSDGDPPGDDDDGTDPSDDDAGDGADTGDDDDETDPTGDADDNGDDGVPVEEEEFWDIVAFQDAYAYEVTSHEENVDMVGRFDGENMYWRVEQGPEVMEMYQIDDELYLVENEQDCLIMDSDSSYPGMEPIDPDETDPEEAAREDVSITRLGPDTIDGDAVIRYEIEPPDEADTAIWYILADSGYPRRLETNEATIDWFYDDIEPVEPPDLECEELPNF